MMYHSITAGTFKEWEREIVSIGNKMKELNMTIVSAALTCNRKRAMKMLRLAFSRRDGCIQHSIQRNCASKSINPPPLFLCQLTFVFDVVACH